MAEDGITITRVFDAPRERIWREWTEPERFGDWFGGPDAESSGVSMDVREGGGWRLTMHVGGRDIAWKGRYVEVVAPERLVFTITDQPVDHESELIIVDLTDLGDGRTEMRFQQRGGGLTAEGYERAGQGWGVFLDTMERRLLAAQE